MSTKLLIKKLREKRKWTIAELANQSGVAVPSLTNYESGKTDPGLSILIKLARAFDVNINELIDEKYTRKPQKYEWINTKFDTYTGHPCVVFANDKFKDMRVHSKWRIKMEEVVE